MRFMAARLNVTVGNWIVHVASQANQLAHQQDIALRAKAHGSRRSRYSSVLFK
ncbi:hypothetical protein MCEMAEM21_02065 [Oxalobacteraceae bacterium]